MLKEKLCALLRGVLYTSIAVAPTMLVGCGDKEEAADPPAAVSSNANANVPGTMHGVAFVATEHGDYSTNYVGRMEMPHVEGEGCVLATHVTDDYNGLQVNYSVLYDSRVHHSRWVAYSFNKTTSANRVGRKPYTEKPQYPQDPLCPEWSLPSDLSFSGYDHGHLCASAERYYSRQANDQTFYMTDMSPQVHAFNESDWTKFESFLYSTARNKQTAPDELYVVKGGTVRQDQLKGSFTQQGYTIAVPRYYFIACLARTGSNYKAIGFWVEHKAYGGNIRLSDYAVSIDRLEELTGFDFFCNLPDAAENAVEQLCSPSAWSLP